MKYDVLTPRRGLGPVTLQLRRASWLQRVYGWADPQLRTVRIYWHPLWSRARVEQTYVHELSHLSGLPGCAGHRRLFKSLVLRRAEAALGVTLPTEAVSWSMAAIDWGIVWRRWWTSPTSILPCTPSWLQTLRVSAEEPSSPCGPVARPRAGDRSPGPTPSPAPRTRGLPQR